ncbi:SGNH/GDSL hydrolase family protein [Noviherbaspirillum cavernae]|nr:SGNH/GDSL hydrolase family protein [Noviherbaspirillum cavernae]
MRITYPSLLFLSLVLASCGGGGGGTTTPAAQNTNTTPPTTTPGGTTTTPPTTTPGGTTTPPPTTTPNNTPRVVEYYGDSTIRGCKTDTNCQQQAAKPAPQAFDETLPATPNHTVSNKGVDSTYACQLLNGGNRDQDGVTVLGSWQQRMAASRATHVIVNYGINDRLQYDVNTYKQCLFSIARVAKQSGKQIIFETPNPITAGDVGPYAQAMREVAAQTDIQAPVIDQFTYLSNKYQGRITEIVPDGLHPTDAVYVEKGQFAAQEFQKKCGNFTCTLN